MSTDRQALGTRAEAFAEQWFRDQGWRVIDRNWRCPYGELDLVLIKNERIHFLEVKARAFVRVQHALEAITPAKRVRLARAIDEWLRTHEAYRTHNYQVDAFCVWREKSVWSYLWIEGI